MVEPTPFTAPAPDILQETIDQEDQITTFPDGSIEIGPTDDGYDIIGLTEFDSNLTSMFTDEELVALGSQMLTEYEQDEADRKEWLETYKKGLKSLQPSSTNPAGTKLSTASHPIMAEVATQFQARTIVELFPPQGPVGVTIVGEATTETQEQATRATKYMNYQLTEEIDDYYDDLDQMLWHLPLVGQTYKKTYYDVDLGRVNSKFVHAENLVVNIDATNLQNAERSHEKIQIPRQQYTRYEYNGFYDPLEDGTSSLIEETTINEVEGTSAPTNPDDNPYEFIESHVYLDLESAADEPDRPYIVTTNTQTSQVVSVRRNWDEEDETYRKNVWYTTYRFLPGLGFYGYGLYHIIGGLGTAATGALRSLLDAAAFSNMQGGFKLRGRVKGGEIQIAPGEFTDIEAAVDDVKKAIMPLPFKEPSPTMMALLEFVVRTAKEFAATAQTGVSDANQNTPVGTTMALMEEQNRVYSAVHKRLHRAQRHEFKLIAKLNGMYLPESYPYNVGGDAKVLKSDFDNRIDIIPVSDPSTFSSTQRIAQAQAMLQLATQYPQEHRLNSALKRMYEAMRVPNYDEVLIDSTKDIRMDAVAENVAMLQQQPVHVFEDQDHQAHIQVLDMWFQALPPEMAQGLAQQYLAHRSEHVSYLYRTIVQAQLQAPLPPVTNQEEQQPLPPHVDAMISQAAAQLTLKGPLAPPAPQPQQPQGAPGQGDPMQTAEQMAQIEAMAIQAKAKADVEAKKLKAQTDSQIRMAEAKLEMQLDVIRTQAKAQAEIIREQRKEGLETKKMEAELEKMWAKAETDMAIAQEKAYATLQTEKHKERMKEMDKQLQLSITPPENNRFADDGN